ncbi:MAG TPA: hypothetical protein VKT82_06500 [Ktedonobacterales bacterium]|nr:hypothetical protein [Ktedonobacterales bacterium]
MVKQPSLPRWLKPANRLIIFLQRRGLALGPVHVLSVPGRTSGQMRTTPVSLLTVNGQRYTVGGMIDADWVKNARAAGWGVLAYGRNQEHVALTELPEAERGPILRVFPKLVPGGVSFFQRLYGLSSDPATLPDEFAALAPRCAVFRIGPLPDGKSDA